MDKTNAWYVYILLSDQKTFYVGITNDIISRFTQHRNRNSIYTKRFSDVVMVYCEQYKTEHMAAMREKQLKGWSRAKKNLLLSGELGINVCTEHVEALLKHES